LHEIRVLFVLEMQSFGIANCKQSSAASKPSAK